MSYRRRTATPTAIDRLSLSGWPVAVGQATSAHHPPQHRPVSHSYAALTFYVDGGAEIEQGSRWRIRAGDIHLIPAGDAHRGVHAQPNTRYWWMALCVPCLAREETRSLLEPFERVRDGGAAVVSVAADRHLYLETLLGELASLAARPTASTAKLQQSLLTLVLHEVTRAGPQLADRPSASSSVVTESLRFIERNALGPLSLSDVAQAVGRSPAYVTTAVKHATGQSVGAWILAARMAEARRLLIASDEYVDVIGERVGYVDPTHFIRMFRRTFGETPAAWRRARLAEFSSGLVPT